jgi:bifunctional UDP-N-acetylglucosamine pyrophosphorylase/glucosamine-1-phosphate N-acetyltransferase
MKKITANKYSIVILAAGAGKRMHSTLPKVLHPIGGKSMLEHVVDTAEKLVPEKIYVVFGKSHPEVKNNLPHLKVQWVQQDQQSGTAHAAAQALSYIPNDHQVLVLYADAPLISTHTLEKLLKTPGISWLTVFIDNPAGFGRIVRTENNKPIAIIEDADASESQKKIQEINTGICSFPADFLKTMIPTLQAHNAQGEYYLTDLFEIATKENHALQIFHAESILETQGANDREQLSQLERIYQMQQAEALMKKGVTLKDPKRFDLRGTLTAAQDVTIDINVIIEGEVSIGKNSIIGPNVILKNVKIGENVTIKANCVIEDSIIHKNCQVGPFAHLRPGTVLEESAKIGNFVEVKKSHIGAYSKVSHLSYIGDTTMGAHVNIGAGTITCNYDGVNKHQTIIKNNTFIGANNSLVAPVTIEEGATTGSGSTISKDAPAGKLTIARAKQVTMDKWKRPEKIS